MSRIVIRSVSVTVVESQPGWLHDVQQHYDYALHRMGSGDFAGAASLMRFIQRLYQQAGYPFLPPLLQELYDAAHVAHAQAVLSLAAPLPRALRG